VSDNGSQFSSDEFATYMKRNGIKHFKSAPYHPATNGLAERFIQTFKNSMRAMKDENKDCEWCNGYSAKDYYIYMFI
jgi:transposase InsO family protein